MLDGIFLWKHLWLDKRITKSEITTVSHNYPVNLHKDITKGGWGGWKIEGYDNNNYPQLGKAGSSAFTLSAVLSVIIKTFIQNTLKKNTRQIITSMCYKRKTKWENYRNIWQKLLDHRFWHQWNKQKTLCLVSV